jgi:hypothetical protein
VSEIAFESDGVRIGVVSDRAEVTDRIRDLLPPGATPCAFDSVEESFGLITAENGSYTFVRNMDPVSKNLDLEFGLSMLQNQIRIYIGIHAPDKIFIHSGVVAVGDRAILLPGRSFAGKTTLVAAFVRAGATYLSDEFAVVDPEGLVHPYTTALSIRGSDETRTDVEATELGGVIGDRAYPVGAVIVTTFRPGAEWAPQELTPGRASLALLQNTLAALHRPEEALPVLNLATTGALLLEGERGEPDALIADVLARLG